jgi:hypothetical protein
MKDIDFLLAEARNAGLDEAAALLEARMKELEQGLAAKTGPAEDLARDWAAEIRALKSWRPWGEPK